MKIITNKIRIKPIFGFGYWKDRYDRVKTGFEGITHHIIIGCFLIDIGYLIKTEEDMIKQLEREFKRDLTEEEILGIKTYMKEYGF